MTGGNRFCDHSTTKGIGVTILRDNGLRETQRAHRMSLQASVDVAQEKRVASCDTDGVRIGIGFTVDQVVLRAVLTDVKGCRICAVVERGIQFAEHQDLFDVKS